MIGEDDGKGKSHFQAPDNVNNILYNIIWKYIVLYQLYLYFFPKFLSQAEILFVYTLWNINVNENLSYLKYIHGFNIL